jgi:hypothetical protein
MSGSSSTIRIVTAAFVVSLASTPAAATACATGRAGLCSISGNSTTCPSAAAKTSSAPPRATTRWRPISTRCSTAASSRKGS